jgi:hypothetical protein
VDDAELDPDAYEAATGISRTAYERRFVAAVRYSLMEQPVWFDFDAHDRPRQVAHNCLAPDGGAVEQVKLRRDGEAAFVIVLFRTDRLRGRRLGWRIPVWPAPAEPPEEWADLFTVYLDEEINDFLATAATVTPDADGISWMPDYR